MEANTPSNTRHKPPARLTAAPSDAAWHEISAVRLIAGVAVVLAAWLAIELIVAGWKWLAAAKFVVAMAAGASA